MNLTLCILSFIILLALGIHRYIISPALFSSLSRIPHAHPASAYTSLWFEKQCRQSKELRTLHAAHKWAGPIVRLSPNEISVVSQEGLREIYTRGLEKHPWYTGMFLLYGVRNLVCTLDHKFHSTRRRMISPLYQKSYIQRSQDMHVLSKHIIFDRFLPLLRTHATESLDIDVVKLFERVGVDFSSAYIFGTACGTDFLYNEDAAAQYLDEWSKSRRSEDADAGKRASEELCMSMCKAALSHHRSRRHDGSTHPLIFSRIHDQLSSAAKAGKSPSSETEIMKECASEMLDHIIATQETNTVTWTYILYHLSLHPELQAKLRAELRTLHPCVSLRHNALTNGLPQAADIDRLPLLDAIIRETLRLHAANPARMRRVVPIGGISLHGHHIPAGTTVSSNAYCLHRNEDVYPKADEWLPQRWMLEGEVPTNQETLKLESMSKWFWAFGSGPRQCIGMNFAMQVIKLVVAAIYTEHTTIIINDNGIEQTDSYNSGPASHRLILQFRCVET